MNYEDAQDIMHRHRAAVESSYGAVRDKASPIRRRLENATTLGFVDEKFTVSCAPEYELRIFNNPIITYRKASFSINDHGWYGRTTHMRLNQYMPHGFGIYTKRIPQLPGIKHVSLVKTPTGEYPYNLPASFTYAGGSMGGWYSCDAGAALVAMPGYIEDYLKRLLNRLPCDNDVNTDCIYTLKDTNPFGHSRTLASCIIDNFHFSNLAMVALADTDLSQEDFHSGLSLLEIVNVLVSEGFAPFKTPRTINQLAVREENAIKYQHRIPSIPAVWITTRLRPVLYEYMINSLGFARAEWNRR